MVPSRLRAWMQILGRHERPPGSPGALDQAPGPRCPGRRVRPPGRFVEGNGPVSAGPTAEEEPSGGDRPPDAAAGTARWARAPRGERTLWFAAGAVLIVGAVALLIGVRHRAEDLATGMRYALGLGLRGAVFLMLLGGTYCVVRGRWRD